MKKFAKDFIEGFLLWVVGFIPSMYFRLFIYKHIYGIQIAPKVVVYKGAEIRGFKKLQIGKGSIIGDYAMLDARAGLTIGENVNFSD